MNTRPHFSLLATSFAGGPRPRNAALILAALWFLIFFCSLFSPPLLDDADATHAQAARAMATTGDLVTLKVDGIRYLEKAPLPYWLAALSFRVFGYNTFAAHLPQALAVLMLMLLGHRWANQAFGSRTGFYTGISLLSSVGVFLFTRTLIPEVWLSLFLTASLFGFLKSLGPMAVPGRISELQIGEVRERPALAFDAGPLFYPYLMWGSMALAVLTKGLVALILVVSTVLVYLLLTEEWKKWRRLRPLEGTLLFLVIAAPWHILAGFRNTNDANGHGFFWFYFWNEHVLRFLGQRLPHDYNKMPGWLFWGAQLVWMFPWTLFLPLGIGALLRRQKHQTAVLTRHLDSRRARSWTFLISFMCLFLALQARRWLRLDVASFVAAFLLVTGINLASRRVRAGLSASPFHRIDPQQKTILLLSLFAGTVLLFFSLSTNQEYYTFPAYLPILLLIAATITRAEQTYASDASARRWVTFAHVMLMTICGVAAVMLLYGLWVSRRRAAADIGQLLAHRGIGDYTLSMSHLFDLTADSFAALRLPAALAVITFAVGPLMAWLLRAQRRHLAATTAVAFTSGLFLVAAHVAFARFGPILSSEQMAAQIASLEREEQVARDSEVLLYGDQAYGSSIPFYLGTPVGLVNGRSTSMLFGSTFSDAPHVFLSSDELQKAWGNGRRKILFIPLEKRNEVDELLRGRIQVVLMEQSGKALITDRPVEAGLAR